jgi:hypothetical protein
MTPVAATLTLIDFQSAVAALDNHRRLTPPNFARRQVLAQAGDTCPLCHQPYDRSTLRGFSHPVIATVVHTFLGGPLTLDNLFTCCRRCQQSRASSDLLTCDNLPPALAAQRLTALQVSHNHLLPLAPSLSLPAFRQALVQRHAFPRSRVYAAQSDDGTCYLAITSRYGDRQSKGLARLLAQSAGTPLIRTTQQTIYRLDDAAFRRVVWQLIDANAWVIGVGRRSDLRDFLDHWWLTSASVAELRLRRVAGVRVPAGEVKREVKARALRQRKLVARRRAETEKRTSVSALKVAESEFDQAMARLHDHQKLGLTGELDETRYFVNRYWLAFAKVYGQA